MGRSGSSDHNAGTWQLPEVFHLNQMFFGRMNRVRMFFQIGTRSPRRNFSYNSCRLSAPRPFQAAPNARPVVAYDNTGKLLK